MKLFHISEEGQIDQFIPQLASRKDREGQYLVWAISETKVYHYFLPRDCPRVIFFPTKNSLEKDVHSLMGYSTAQTVIAIEKQWIPKILNTALYQYEFDPKNFILDDANAGYYVSRETEIPIRVKKIASTLEALAKHEVEIRFLPSLWPLREKVIHSTLGFSIIRMRNAAPPDKGFNNYHSLSK